MAVAKCVTVSGRSRGQLSTYFQRREAVWPSFCAHAELERWTAAGPLARKPRRALVERFLTTAKRPPEASSIHPLHRGGKRSLGAAPSTPAPPALRPWAEELRAASVSSPAPAAACRTEASRPQKEHTSRTESDAPPDAHLTRQKRRLALLAAGARALVAPVAPARPATVAKAFEASQMEGAQAPFGFWDPFGFAKTSPEALTWYRAAELKHGRVAMVACMGFIAQSFPLTKMADVPLAKASLYPLSLIHI